jgi:hypothetical protein
MYRKFLIIFILINLTSIITLILSTAYFSNITSIYEASINEDIRKYLKLKNVFSQPLVYLHFVILLIDLLYFIVFLIFNNKRLSQSLGLQTNKISVQSSNDYSNFFLEILFALLIKALGLATSLFFNFKSKDEINLHCDIEKDKSIVNMLSHSTEYLNFMLWADTFSIILFTFYYLTKYIQIRNKNEKGKNSINIKDNFTSLN